MTVQQFMATHTRRIADSLCHFVETTAEDYRNWQPPAQGCETRSVLQQISECIQVNQIFAKLLRGEAVESYGWPDIPFVDAADAQKQLVASAEELASAIENLSDAGLEQTFNHPKAQIRGENLIMMGYRNMAYHAGQINLIQTLGGDPEFHVPSNWR